MPRFVAFLGSINVGGHRVTMERLRAEFETLGFTEVWTFIASGNVVFRASAKPTSLEPKIEKHLSKTLGFPVTAFVRTDADVARIAEHVPFRVNAGDSHYVGLLREVPTAPATKATVALSGERDTLVVHRTELHWRVHGVSLDSNVKPSALGKAIGQAMTTRNATSLRKLAAKLETA